MDPARLLEVETERWFAFRQVLDAVPADRWDEPTVTAEGWTVTTVAVHCAAWLDRCAHVLDAVTRGGYDPTSEPEETDAYLDDVNAGHAARAVGMGRTAAVAELEEARARARAAFDAVPAPDAHTWAWFDESAPLHYEKHRRDLLAFSGRAEDLP
jgi:Mycothiol maleylpyruvate isomerase N-terminal domain